MKKGRIITICNVVGIMAIGILSIPLTQVEAQSSHQHQHMTKLDMQKQSPSKAATLKQIHSGYLPSALKAIDRVIAAIERGYKKTALAELHKTKNSLLVSQAILSKHIQPMFVNDRCPLMGSPIKPSKVTANLVREYKGQKVAFCCAGCPAAWDKLSKAEKESKLAKVTKAMSMDTWTCSMHPQIRQPKPGKCPLCNMALIKVAPKPTKPLK